MTTTEPYVPTVYEALREAISTVGYVPADGVNQNQNFKFRSIDGVVGATRGALLHHGINFIPSFENIEQRDYVKDDGRITHRAVLKGTFRVIGPRGDEFSFDMIGEAMDTEGRASNKATSAATKNALIRLLHLGAGDDGDLSDAAPATPQYASAPAPQYQQAQTQGLAGRVQQAAARPAPVPQEGPTGVELLTEGQGKNLYRLWKHKLGWDKTRFLQEVELVTNQHYVDDRQLTKYHASDVIQRLKALAGEEVDAPQQGNPVPNEPPVYEEAGQFGYSEAPF